MKAFLVLFITAFSLSAIAQIMGPPEGVQPKSSVPVEATKDERLLICDAIQTYTVDNGTDFALDYKACLKNTTIQSEYFSTVLATDIRLVAGTILFNAPERRSYKAHCKLTYFGAAKLKNVVGSTETGIVCE